MNTTLLAVLLPAALLAVSPLALLGYAAIKQVRNTVARAALTALDRVLELSVHRALAALPSGSAATFAAVKDEALKIAGVIGPDTLAAIRTAKGGGASAYIDAALVRILADLGLPGTPDPLSRAAAARAAHVAR